ncbi:hypothetical protein [Bartonella sp. AC53GZZY]
MLLLAYVLNATFFVSSFGGRALNSERERLVSGIRVIMNDQGKTFENL